MISYSILLWRCLTCDVTAAHVEATVCATLFAASLYFAREAFSAGSSVHHSWVGGLLGCVLCARYFSYSSSCYGPHLWPS
eukprot:2347779-Amphidinium_carterae.1